MTPSPSRKPRPDIPLGHTIPAHQAFGWCAYCPNRTPAEELAAWQTHEPIAEIERLRLENGRMRHELEVMYAGALDSLKTALAPATTDAGETVDSSWAAEGLPLNALKSATNGATMIDAWAEDPNGRNFLAHALVQLARDGWLRQEPDLTEAFDVSDRPRVVPAPQPAPAGDDCCGAVPPRTVVDEDGKEWTPGDCWCTLPPDHDDELHRCQPCSDRHGAPGWKDDA